jgi:hypothetical protein
MHREIEMSAISLLRAINLTVMGTREIGKEKRMPGKVLS